MTYDLEQRTCRGCPSVFRVMPTSLNYFCCITCHYLWEARRRIKEKVQSEEYATTKEIYERWREENSDNAEESK